jgi:hypothetical protein
MSRTLFENSKAALAFAGVTIIGAVIMIGSPDNEGVLDKTVDSFVEDREDSAAIGTEPVEAQIQPVRISDPAAGWGSSQKSVYPESRQEDPPPNTFTDDSPRPEKPGKRQQQGLIPGPQPVVADNIGIPVPGPD